MKNLTFSLIDTLKDPENGILILTYYAPVKRMTGNGTIVKTVTIIADVVGYVQEQGKLQPQAMMQRQMSESSVFIKDLTIQ